MAEKVAWFSCGATSAVAYAEAALNALLEDK